MGFVIQRWKVWNPPPSYHGGGFDTFHLYMTNPILMDRTLSIASLVEKNVFGSFLALQKRTQDNATHVWYTLQTRPGWQALLLLRAPYVHIHRIRWARSWRGCHDDPVRHDAQIFGQKHCLSARAPASAHSARTPAYVWTPLACLVLCGEYQNKPYTKSTLIFLTLGSIQQSNTLRVLDSDWLMLLLLLPKK